MDRWTGGPGREPARAWPPAGPVLAVGLAGVALWILGDVLLLVFAGALIAVGLDGAARTLAGHAPIGRRWALATVALAVFGALAGLGYLTAPRILAQVGDLWTLGETVVSGAQAALERSGLPLERLMGEAGGQERLVDAAGALAGRMAGFTLGALGATTSAAVAIVLAIFAAADPDLYRRGALALLPPGRRPRADATLGAIAHALRWWFLGQLVSMLMLGVTVGAGLWAIGVEQWLALAALTAALTFVPVLGPIIAGVPVVIVGFAAGPQTGLIVLAFYLVVQNVEGNFVTPMILHRAVDLPPALLIAAQVVLSVLFGFAGLVLAAPLTVVAMVATQKLHVEPMARPADAAAGARGGS